MSVSKIRQLRKEKVELIAKYKQEMQAIQQDSRFEAHYVREQIKEIQDKINQVKLGHDQQIKELIEQGKNEYSAKLKNSEFDGLTEKDLIRKLIIDNRNRDIESRLLTKYKDNKKGLFEEVKRELETGALTAQGYANAFWKLNEDPFKREVIENLEAGYRRSNFNDMQKAYAAEIESYEQQEAEYKQELADELFQSKLDKYE